MNMAFNVKIVTRVVSWTAYIINRIIAVYRILTAPQLALEYFKPNPGHDFGKHDLTETLTLL